MIAKGFICDSRHFKQGSNYLPLTILSPYVLWEITSLNGRCLTQFEIFVWRCLQSFLLANWYVDSQRVSDTLKGTVGSNASHVLSQQHLRLMGSQQFSGPQNLPVLFANIICWKHGYGHLFEWSWLLILLGTRITPSVSFNPRTVDCTSPESPKVQEGFQFWATCPFNLQAG